MSKFKLLTIFPKLFFLQLSRFWYHKKKRVNTNPENIVLIISNGAIGDFYTRLFVCKKIVEKLCKKNSAIKITIFINRNLSNDTSAKLKNFENLLHEFTKKIIFKQQSNIKIIFVPNINKIFNSSNLNKADIVYYFGEFFLSLLTALKLYKLFGKANCTHIFIDFARSRHDYYYNFIFKNSSLLKKKYMKLNNIVISIIIFLLKHHMFFIASFYPKNLVKEFNSLPNKDNCANIYFLLYSLNKLQNLNFVNPLPPTSIEHFNNLLRTKKNLVITPKSANPLKNITVNEIETIVKNVKKNNSNLKITLIDINFNHYSRFISKNVSIFNFQNINHNNLDKLFSSCDLLITAESAPLHLINFYPKISVAVVAPKKIGTNNFYSPPYNSHLIVYDAAKLGSNFNSNNDKKNKYQRQM